MKNEFSPFMDKLVAHYLTNESIDRIASVCGQDNMLVSETLYGNIINHLYMLISNLSMECVIDKYHKWRLSIDKQEADRKKRLSMFIDYLFSDQKHEAIDCFICEYPVLDKLVRERVADYVSEYCDIVSMFCIEHQDIEMLIGKNLGSICDIQLSVGDIHNGSSVAIVHMSSSSKLVFKPKALHINNIISEVLTFVVNNMPGKIDFLLPKHLIYSNHTWQEFVQREECLSYEQVYRYYYRIGIYLAIFHVLGSTDMHFENLVSCGEYPVFIDLETLLSGRRKGEVSLSPKNPLNSVYQTSILPLLDGTSTHGLNMSAIFTGEQISALDYQYYLMEDDDLDWVYKKFPSVLTPHDNVVLLNSEDVPPALVESHVIKGFSDAYDCFFKNKTSFIDIVNTFSDKIAVRQLLRASTVYAKFITASLHPRFLYSFQEYDSVFEILLHNFKPTSYGYLRVNSEIEQLRKGYIPLFYTYMDSCNLYSENNMVCKDYFVQSPRAGIIDRIKNMSQELRDYQIRFIKMAFLTLYGPKDKIDAKSISAQHTKISPLWIKKQLAEYAEHLKTTIIDVGNEQYSIMMPYTSKNGFTIKSMDIELYHVGGLIWFLAVYGKHYEAEYIKYAKGMYALLASTYNREKNIQTNGNLSSLSIYGGSASLLYLSYNFYMLFGDHIYKNESIRLVDDIVHQLQIDKTSVYEIDYVSGLSSSIYFLCKIYSLELSLSENDKTIRTIDFERICAQYLDLVSKYLVETTIPDEIAHGKAGICIVLLEINKVKKTDTYILDTILELLPDCVKMPTVNGTHGWCRGTAGYIHLCTNIMQGIDTDHELFVKAQRYIDLINAQGWERLFEDEQLCLCHGKYGIVDTLLTLTEHGIVPQIDYLNVKWFSTLSDLRFFRSTDYGLESFMIGSSGVAYTLLRQMNKKLPSLLNLDIYEGKE